ncbi:MAG: preprotein translocase subunit SecG [Phycisphaerales bacterium]|nr:MAG: preprotein translocase subunit SecG [Phycisphaerales bacterium]
MLAAMTGFQFAFTLFYVLVCILLIGVVLLQKGRGGGIGSAFGGGATTSPFGAKTGDVFTWVTVVLAGLAILIGVVGNYILEPTIPIEQAQAAPPAGQQAMPPATGPEPIQPGTTPALPAGQAPAPAQLPPESAGGESPSGTQETDRPATPPGTEESSE